MAIGTLSQRVRRPKAEGYNIRVDAQWFRTVAGPQSPLQIGTRDSLAERIDQRSSIYNNILDIGYAWGRTDMSGGEGLDWDPRELALEQEQVALDPIRFWDSENIDVRRSREGNIASITLSSREEIWKNFVALNDLATSDKHLFVSYGTTLEWWADWDGAPVDSATASAAIKRIEASDAGDVAVLLDDETMQYLPAGTNTLVAIPGLVDVQRHWFAKGRFIAFTQDVSGNSALVEFDINGVIGAGPFLTFRGECLSMVSSGPAVVGAFSDGTIRSFVPEQSNQIDPSSVSLVIRGITDMPTGEVPFLLGSNADVLLIETRTTGDEPDNTLRLYQAQVLDERSDYVIGQLQLRREWYDTASITEPLKNMANTRDEIWFIIHEATNKEMVWRFDLVTNGMSRHLTTPLDVAHSIVVFDEVTGFVSGTDVYKSSDLYAADSYLITPNITFGLNTDITWIAAVLEARNFLGQTDRVQLFRTSNPEAILDAAHQDWVLIKEFATVGSTNVEVSLTNVKSRTLAMKLQILPTSDTSSAPVVTRTAIRGIPAHRDLIMMVPFNVSDYLSVPGRKPARVAGLGYDIHEKVLNLVGKSVQATVLDPPIVFNGIVNNISEPVEYLSERGSVTRYVMVEFRGSRITSATAGSSDVGVGIPVVGIPLVGTELPLGV